MAAASYDPESDPWTALRRNLTFAAEKIRLCPNLLRPMVASDIISQGDYEELLMESIPKRKRIDRLLLEILPTRPSEMFSVFCDILRRVGQYELADRLQGIRGDRGQSGNGSGDQRVAAEQTGQSRREEELEARLSELERQRTEDLQERRLLREQMASLNQTLQARQSAPVGQPSNTTSTPEVIPIQEPHDQGLGQINHRNICTTTASTESRDGPSIQSETASQSERRDDYGRRKNRETGDQLVYIAPEQQSTGPATLPASRQTSS